MEQLFELAMEVEDGVDVEQIRHWLDVILDGKLDFQYFLANHAGAYSGWDTIDGKLFVRNSSPVSIQDIEGFLQVPNEIVKAIKISVI